MAKLKTSGWRGGSVKKWRNAAEGNLDKFRAAAEADGYDVGENAEKLMTPKDKPKATKSQQMAAGLKGKKTSFPYGANAKEGEKPTMEEVSKVKAIIDQMGLERLKAAMRVAEEIA